MALDPVLQPLHEDALVAHLVDELDVDQVIIATSGGDLLARELVDLCMDSEVRLRILPDIDTVLQDTHGTGDIRDLELSDLLPRKKIETDLAAVAQLVAGRTVLVTGAGGSIGSELVRQVLEFNPGHLVALDHDETHLHDAEVSWRAASPIRVIAELADVRDESRIRSVFNRHRPAVVFHAAAHKHVPILERCPSEAVKTNVFGTDIVLRAAQDHGVARFVLISTDKAVTYRRTGGDERSSDMTRYEGHGHGR